MKALLGKRILIEPIDPAAKAIKTEDGKTVSLVLELEGAPMKKRPFEGIVKYVGVKVEDIEPGDHIHFNQAAGKDFPYDGKSYLLIHEQDVNGIYLTPQE